MIEIEVYARGLRADNAVMQLRSQMDLLPRIRYKMDTHHDMVYFEIDDPSEVSLKQIHHLFADIGLNPRFVGQIPDGLRNPEETARIR